MIEDTISDVRILREVLSHKVWHFQEYIYDVSAFSLSRPPSYHRGRLKVQIAR